MHKDINTGAEEIKQVPIHFYDIHNPDESIPVEMILKQDSRRSNGNFYVPLQIPVLPDSLLYKNPPPSFREVAFEVSQAFFHGIIPEADLYTLIAEAFPFKVPVFPIDPRTYILELTHGESGSLADFGARFTAQLIAYFHKHNTRPLHILYAGAETSLLSFAKAFSEHEQFHCTFLYPKGSLPAATEQQLLALSQNIHPFAVEGSLHDCQNMLKAAVSNTTINKSAELFVPHESYIGFLLAYTFCCVYASLAVLSRSSYDNSIEKPQLIIGFPFRQLSSITAAVLAKKMNAPITGFITASDLSYSLPHNLLRDFRITPVSYENTTYTASTCCENEYQRLKMLYDGINPALDIALYRLQQHDIIDAMRTCNDRTGIIISPDAAAIWQVWNAVKLGATTNMGFTDAADKHSTILPCWGKNKDTIRSCISIIAETSHPALHTASIRSAIGREPPIPYRFEYNQQGVRHPVCMVPSTIALQDWLFSLT